MSERNCEINLKEIGKEYSIGAVDTLEMSLEEAREYLFKGEGDIADELENMLDSAQGEIHQGKSKVRYIVIKITE